MAKFTFTSEIDGVAVTHTFEAEVLPEIQKRFNDFIEGSGFVLPEESDDFIAKEEDWMWDDALSSKFSDFELNSTYLPGGDSVISGAQGADIISFPTRNDK